MGITPVDLRDVDNSASNIYEAIIVAAKRARQLNDEIKIEYNALVSTIPVAAGEDDAEDIQNPAQLKISLDFEKREKCHIQSLHELLDSAIEYKYKEKSN